MDKQMDKQMVIVELWGFDDTEHVQEFFGEILANYQWGPKQYIKISNLNEKGKKIVEEHIFSNKEDIK